MPFPHMQCKTNPENTISVIYFPFNTTGYILVHWYHLAWGFHQFHVLSLLNSRMLTPINLVICPTAKEEVQLNSLLFSKSYALDAQMYMIRTY